MDVFNTICECILNLPRVCKIPELNFVLSNTINYERCFQFSCRLAGMQQFPIARTVYTYRKIADGFVSEPFLNDFSTIY